MAIHGAVRLDIVASRKTGKLKHVKVSQDMDNGSVVHVGDLAANERELRQVVQPTTASIATEPLYLIDTPETTYLAGQVITDFVNVNGAPARARLFETGDTITITNMMITGTPAVDSYVAPANGSYLLSVVGTTEPSTRFIGKIIELDTIYGQPATVIEVIKN